MKTSVRDVRILKGVLNPPARRVSIAAMNRAIARMGRIAASR